MDLEEHHAEIKSTSERQILYDTFYTWNLKLNRTKLRKTQQTKQNKTCENKIKYWLPGTWEWENVV